MSGGGKIKKRKLTRDERDTLYRAARFELLEANPGEEVDRARLVRAGEVIPAFLALFDDIGWEEAGDDRSTYTLTVPGGLLVLIAQMIVTSARELIADAEPEVSPGHQHLAEYREDLRLGLALGGGDE